MSAESECKVASHSQHAHLHVLRAMWNSLDAAGRAEHVAQPGHTYALLSSFVARGCTEGSVCQFFACLRHIGAAAEAGGEPRQFAFGPSTCAEVAALLDGLIAAAAIAAMPNTVDEQSLHTISRILQLASADFAAQGWSHDRTHNFAFRTRQSDTTQVGAWNV